MAKQPYIPLYTGDYLKDTRRLTLEVRGAWVDLLIFMWESEEKGTITATLDEFALMFGCSFKKADSIIAELKEKKICDFEVKSDGKIKLISRRIVRDVELSIKRKKAGKEGGNPNLLNQKQGTEKKFGYPNSDIDNDTEGSVHLNKKEIQQKIEDSLFADEVFIEGLRSAHRDKDLRQAFRECYVHHSNGPNPPRELWMWRQKLNTWLTIKPAGKKKQTTQKKFTIDDLKP